LHSSQFIEKSSAELSTAPHANGGLMRNKTVKHKLLAQSRHELVRRTRPLSAAKADVTTTYFLCPFENCEQIRCRRSIAVLRFLTFDHS
jgi:hypothetical protein